MKITKRTCIFSRPNRCLSCRQLRLSVHRMCKQLNLWASWCWISQTLPPRILQVWSSYRISRPLNSNSRAFRCRVKCLSLHQNSNIMLSFLKVGGWRGNCWAVIRRKTKVYCRSLNRRRNNLNWMTLQEVVNYSRAEESKPNSQMISILLIAKM